MRRICKKDMISGVIGLSAQQRDAFRSAVEAAAGDSLARGAVQNLYIALQDAIDLRKPVCDRSGRCCRFEEWGHSLFVTTLEMAAFLGQLEESPQPNPGGCPFQKGGLCSVHSIRPLGCRIYFCDPSATDWQRNQYSRFHDLLRRLHEERGVPYFYVEWRQALECLNIDGRGPSAESRV